MVLEFKVQKGKRKAYIPKVHDYILKVPMLSSNECEVVNFLTRRFKEKYNINQLAREIGLSPKGMHKLLRRLEEGGILKRQRLGNAVFYAMNFGSDKACKIAEFSLIEEIKLPYARAQAKDIERFRPQVKAAILFGSVLKKGEGANDIDVLMVLEQRQYKKFQQAVNDLQKIKTKRVHIVLQTSRDLVKNLKKSDPVIEEIIKEGNVLWGQENIVAAIREAGQA